MDKSMMDKPIVEYEGTYWVLEKVSESGMATIWRNGQPAIVPSNMLKSTEENKK